jgi:capsular polysaccharide biosynthesis protein
VSEQLRQLTPEALFHLVARRWDLVLLLPVLAVLAAGLTYKLLPAQYESSARLLIQDQQTVNPFMEGLVEEWSAQQRMPLVESIFESHDTSEQVLRKLERLTPDADAREINEAVAKFQKSFEVIGLGGELVLLKVRGETAVEAYNAAVALVDTFTERILYPQRETLRTSAILFQEQLEQLRGDSEVTSVGDESAVGTVKALPEGNIRKALTEAEARLAALEQEADRTEEQLRQLGPERDKLTKSLNQARKRLASLRRRYGSRHPALAAQESRVRSLEDQLRERREAINAGLLRDAATIEESEAAENQALLVELKEASAEVKLLRHQLLAEEISKFAKGNQVWPVESPVMPTLPLGPSVWMVVLGAFFAGLVLALLAVAILSAFDDSIRGERELGEVINAPCLGRMPRGEI